MDLKGTVYWIATHTWRLSERMLQFFQPFPYPDMTYSSTATRHFAKNLSKFCPWTSSNSKNVAPMQSKTFPKRSFMPYGWKRTDLLHGKHECTVGMLLRRKNRRAMATVKTNNSWFLLALITSGAIATAMSMDHEWFSSSTWGSLKVREAWQLGGWSW